MGEGGGQKRKEDREKSKMMPRGVKDRVTDSPFKLDISSRGKRVKPEIAHIDNLKEPVSNLRHTAQYRTLARQVRVDLLIWI